MAMVLSISQLKKGDSSYLLGPTTIDMEPIQHQSLCFFVYMWNY